MPLRQRILSRSQRDDQIKIVGLYFRLVGGTATGCAAAFFTAVNNDVAALGIGLCTHGTQGSPTVVRSVAGVYVHMQRVKTKGAVVARGVAERQDLTPAMGANKAVVVFCKKCCFHTVSHFPTQNLLKMPATTSSPTLMPSVSAKAVSAPSSSVSAASSAKPIESASSAAESLSQPRSRAA